MAAGGHNFVIEQGEDWSRVLTVKTKATSTSVPVVKTLTGYTARMTIKDRYSGTSILSLTTENGRISITGASGIVTLTLTDIETAALAATNNAIYDLELISGAGAVEKLLKGNITIQSEVTV